MKTRNKKWIKTLTITILVACGAVSLVAGPAKAFFPPRALRFALFSQFQMSSMEAIKIIRLTYSDNGRANAESTFEKGEKVYVSIKIYEPGSGSKIKITDRIFNFKSGSVKNFRFNGILVALTPTIPPDANQFSASIETKNGANYFNYEYEVAD